MNERKEYRTEELGLAAGLKVAGGIEFKGTEPGKGRYLTFIFAWDDRIPDIERAFYEGRLKVEVIAFMAAIKILRNLIWRWRHEDNG